MRVTDERGRAVIGNLALIYTGDMVTGDVDTPAADCNMTVRDHLPGLFRRPCESPAVDDGLETAFELGSDLERENCVDVRIGTEEACTLEVADSSSFFTSYWSLWAMAESEGQQVAGGLAVIAQVGLCFPDFALVPGNRAR